MTGPELDDLIYRAESGEPLTMPDQLALVAELKIYRGMSLRLERCVHELVKEAEAGI